MADTGAERLTDTFRYKHHTMPVPTITPTDRIIAATRHLTNALSGTQEAPPDKLQAILSLRQLLLGEAPPPVPVNPPPITSHDAPIPCLDPYDKPIHMWNPNSTQHSAVPTLPHKFTTVTNPPGDHPNVIEDDMLPALHRSQPAQTHAQHRAAHVHLINSTTTCMHTPINLIGAVVDGITGDVFEYRHLIKSDTHKTIWQRSFANKLGRLFQGIRNMKGTDACFFTAIANVPKHKFAT
jgi:hypothetical protein